MGGTIIPSESEIPSHNSIVTSLAQFNVLTGWGSRHVNNRGQGYCGWEASRTARQTHNKESVSLEHFLQLVIQKNEEFKTDINTTDFETIKVRSEEAMEHLQKGLPLPPRGEGAFTWPVG